MKKNNLAYFKRQNLLGSLAYLIGPLTGLTLLALVRKNSYIRYHAMQSTLLFGIILILYMILATTYIGFIIIPFILIAHIIIGFVLMWRALKGEKSIFPVIGYLSKQELERIG